MIINGMLVINNDPLLRPTKSEIINKLRIFAQIEGLETFKEADINCYILDCKLRGRLNDEDIEAAYMLSMNNDIEPYRPLDDDSPRQRQIKKLARAMYNSRYCEMRLQERRKH